jgi:hypothetical protein
MRLVLAAKEIALSPDEVTKLREFLSDLPEDKGMMIVTAPAPGLGEAIMVYPLGESEDIVDITDYANW